MGDKRNVIYIRVKEFVNKNVGVDILQMALILNSDGHVDD